MRDETYDFYMTILIFIQYIQEEVRRTHVSSPVNGEKNERRLQISWPDSGVCGLNIIN